MNARHGFLLRPATWLITGLWPLCRVMLITWTTFAVYYSNLPWSLAAPRVGRNFCGVRHLGPFPIAATMDEPFRTKC